MQKLNEKKILGTVPKKLQLVETFWDCPEFSRNKQNQNGITLIALIITIIVMLILVGVTINVALNGGVFQKAEYASEQMQIKAEEEELLSAVVAAIGNDGKIKFREIELPEGWEGVAEKTFKSPKENIYEVDDYGKITYKGKNTGGENTLVAFNWSDVGLDNVDTSTAYKGYIEPLNITTIVSFTEDGRVIMETNGDITVINAKDNIDDTDTPKKLSFSLEIVSGTTSNIVVTMNGNDINAQIEGLGTITYVKQGKTIYSNEEVLKMLGVSNFAGTYTGTWTVLESDGDGNPTKLVSTSNVTNSTLGEDKNLEKSISDYKNAVSTLNTAAQTATGIDSARSINVEDIETLAGIQDSDKGTYYLKEYTYNYTNHKDQIFVNENGDTVKIDSEGDEVTLTNTSYNYDLKDDQKAKIRALASGHYWLASPCLYCYSSNADFYVRYMNDGCIISSTLFSSDGNAYNHSSGVRAVVSI